MNDTLICPICSCKLRNLKWNNKHLENVNKKADYIERKCTQYLNHSLKFFTDKNTKQVDFIKLSLNHRYSVYAEIDFVNKITTVNCFKNSEKQKSIQIPKVLELDFPELETLREKVNLFITFS